MNRSKGFDLIAAVKNNVTHRVLPALRSIEPQPAPVAVLAGVVTH